MNLTHRWCWIAVSTLALACSSESVPGAASGGASGGAGDASVGSDSATGGAGAGGAPCDDGSQAPAGDCGGSAGAVAVHGDCADRQAAGLAQVSCADAGTGVSLTPALASLCASNTIPMLSVLNQLTAKCFAALGTYDVGTKQLNHAALCAPDHREKVIACMGVSVSCPRLPLCLPGGQTYGCADIVAACPALSHQHCVNGFDSRPHADRLAIAACMAQEPAGKSCDDQFFACAWGI